MAQYSTRVLSVGVDTLTCSAGEDGNLAHLRELGVELMMHSAERKNRVQYFKQGPYIGGQTKQVGYAEWRGRGLVELRGQMAREWWPEVLPLAGKVSRIDVQVTVEQEPYDPAMAVLAWFRAARRAKREGRPPHYTLWADASKGSTLYIGRLGSRFLARMYEKGKEDPKGGWGDAWRYEVQARRERAIQVADELGKAEDGPAWMASMVATHFQRRGIPVIGGVPVVTDLPPLPPEQSDEAKTLRWLGASVAPVLSRLEGMGSLDKGLKALGIGTTLDSS